MDVRADCWRRCEDAIAVLERCLAAARKLSGALPAECAAEISRIVELPYGDRITYDPFYDADAIEFAVRLLKHVCMESG